MVPMTDAEMQEKVNELRERVDEVDRELVRALNERARIVQEIVNAGGTLVIVDEDGEIALASASAAGLRVHARKELLAANAWTPPTVVGGKLYVRDRKEVLALQLSE